MKIIEFLTDEDKKTFRIVLVEDLKLLHKLAEDAILFEAANTLRMGKDLLFPSIIFRQFTKLPNGFSLF